jgi:hypothetical protein
MASKTCPSSAGRPASAIGSTRSVSSSGDVSPIVPPVVERHGPRAANPSAPPNSPRRLRGIAGDALRAALGHDLANALPLVKRPTVNDAWASPPMRMRHPLHLLRHVGARAVDHPAPWPGGCATSLTESARSIGSSSVPTVTYISGPEARLGVTRRALERALLPARDQGVRRWCGMPTASITPPR